jgi:hypothetical protein
MMDNNTIEKCVAILAIALVATVGPKFGLADGLAGTAIAAIAGLAGQGVVSMFRGKREELARVDPP